MSTLSDFFVASSSDADDYDNFVTNHVSSDANRFERACYRGFTDIELGTLWAIVKGEEWDINLHELEAEPTGEEGDSLLLQFPSSFVDALVELDASKQSGVAAEWAETEELACSPENLVPVLIDLHRLAKLAKLRHQELFVWMAN